jgi:hypothetical protein
MASNGDFVRQRMLHTINSAADQVKASVDVFEDSSVPKRPNNPYLSRVEEVIDDAEATIESTINSKPALSKGSLRVPSIITLPRRNGSPASLDDRTRQRFMLVRQGPIRRQSPRSYIQTPSSCPSPSRIPMADYNDKSSAMGFMATSSTTGVDAGVQIHPKPSHSVKRVSK